MIFYVLIINKKYDHFSESQKDELVNIESNLSIQIKDKTTEDNIPDSKLNSSTKLAPLFRTVSVPDEQVPGLNHLVNRPYSWIPQPRSKKPIRGNLIFLFNLKRNKIK